MVIFTGITPLTIERCTASFASRVSKRWGPVSCAGCCCAAGGEVRSSEGNAGSGCAAEGRDESGGSGGLFSMIPVYQPLLH